MAVCLAMFPSSAKYHSYLEGYVYSHLKDNQRPVHKILEQEISVSKDTLNAMEQKTLLIYHIWGRAVYRQNQSIYKKPGGKSGKYLKLAEILKEVAYKQFILCTLAYFRFV
jgi:hypothetical protein